MSTPKKEKPANSYINNEAERAVLGALMLASGEGAILDPIFGMLQDGDFYEPKHQAMFRGLRSLYDEGQPLDEVLLDERLKNSGDLGHVKQNYVHELVNSCVSEYTGPAYAKIVLENGLHRLEAESAFAFGQGTISKAEHLAQLEKLERRADAGASSTFMLDELMRETLPEKRQIIPGYLPEGLAVLGAKQKIGKSWLAYALAIAVGCGGVVLSQRVEEGDVLMLALEDGKRRLQDRARKLLADQAIPRRVTLATEARDWRLDAGGIDRIARWLKNHPDARLVVIDVLAKVRPPRKRGADLYLEDYAVMSSLKALADRYHVAVLVIHHTRKASAEDVYDELNGTMGVAGAADTVWILQRPRGEDIGTLHITGREIEEEGQIPLRFDKATCAWQVMNEQEIATQREQAMSAERRDILDVLKASEKPLGPAEIAIALRINPEADLKAYAAHRVLLGKMVDDKQIARMERGVYTTNDRLQRLQRLQSTHESASNQGLGNVTGVNGNELQRLHSTKPENNGAHNGFVTDVTNVTGNLNGNHNGHTPRPVGETVVVTCPKCGCARLYDCEEYGIRCNVCDTMVKQATPKEAPEGVPA